MIWGGQSIPNTLKLSVSPEAKIGEDFTVSGLKTDVSVVANGALKGQSLIELIQQYKGELLGEKVYRKFGEKFPLLIKFIDANDDLSIQVHPNDDLAKKKHNAFGKTEMWYVMDREEGAKLISGFSKKTSAEEFEEYHQSKNLMSLMQEVETQKGDSFFIPAGKVHSIGKGNLIAEIQQTSDLTYRIFDFDRTDKFGNPRELHHELAKDAMNYADTDTGKVEYEVIKNKSVNLVECTYFTTNFLLVESEVERDYTHLDSFVILINTHGSCELFTGDFQIELKEMESLLVPASVDRIRMKSTTTASLLEVWI